MSDMAIRVENVSKKFSKNLKHVMSYGIQDVTRSVLGMDAVTDRLRKGEFWAVDDISFELKRGEALGVIGLNGSGKTTTLKMLNGIFMPDRGRIEIKGRVGALIQIGSGFHPMLTGRENIYVNGAILGMSRREIDRNFDSIVEFADIGDFLDAPVKHYSSGMFVRLGFAIAIHCRPDVLLVDEILSVGDVNFRRKCAARMRELEKKEVTIVFVTHDMGSLRHVCDRAICLRGGKMVHYGDIDGAISEYMAAPLKMKPEKGAEQMRRQIKDVFIKDKNGEKVRVLYTGESCTFGVDLEVEQRIDSPVVGVAIYDDAGSMIIGVNTRNSGFQIDHIAGKTTAFLEFPVLNLIPGNYRVRAALYDSSMGLIDNVETALLFRVNSKGYSTGSIFSYHQWSMKYDQ